MNIYSCYKVKIQDAPKQELSDTAEAYQSALRFFLDVCLKEWESISAIHADPVTQKGLSDNTVRQQAIEALTHRTRSHALPKYDFDEQFPKFPSYLRRSVIMEALGMVQSYKSNLANWEALAKKNGKPKPPTVGRSFPSMYRGNCFLRLSEQTAKLKAWVRGTWDWVTVTLRKSDAAYIREHCINRKEGCPTLRRRGKNWFLDFPFEERAEINTTPIENRIALGVDLGINSAAVCSAIDAGGAVCGRRFLKLPYENDRLRRSCNLVRRAQRNGAKRMPHLWAGINGQNLAMAIKTARFIVQTALDFGAHVIVFEHLDLQGKKHGRLAQRLHLWNANAIQKMVEDMAHRNGIRVSRVNARNTSKLAFDGSGEVSRDKDNASLCTFTSGKRYNCDLSASYNIGARYFIRELLKPLPVTTRRLLEAEVPPIAKRTTYTLSTLSGLSAALSAPRQKQLSSAPYRAGAVRLPKGASAPF